MKIFFIKGYVAEIEHIDKPILKEFIKKKNNINLVCLDGVNDPKILDL